MSSGTKNHLFWGATFILLIVGIITTREIFAFCVVGSPWDWGIGSGVGCGAVGVAFFSDGSPGIDIETGIESLDKYYWWFGLEEGEYILYIPLWLLSLIPIVFWTLSIRRIQNQDSTENP